MGLDVDNGRRVLLFERHCWALRDMTDKAKLAFFNAMLDFGADGTTDFGQYAGIVRTLMPEIVALSETSWNRANARRAKHRARKSAVQTAHGGADYLGKIVFLGDSRTYGLRHFAMLEGGADTAQVWTPLCGTMSVWDMQNQKIYLPDTGAEMTCAEAAALKRPEILLISLGFIGFEIVDSEYFVSEYLKLIESVQNSSPETVIILQSMFPVCRSYADTRITNAAIRAGNRTILGIARTAGVYYLNTAEALCDADGYLPEAYASDGCHLTPLGLDAELDYICTHQIPEVFK